jgi:4-amino-4-deoxy-L-arabinose transferase-like glycosyltransferase
VTRRAPRTDRTRAGLLLWGGWLLVNGLVFSFMSGTVHPYYSVAMAPGLAGVLAIGVGALWNRRSHWASRLTMVIALAATATWSVVLLDRTPTFLPWLRWVVIVGGVLGSVALVAPPRKLGRAAVVIALVTALAGSAGSTAYAAQTASTAQQGSIISAGPASSGGFQAGAFQGGGFHGGGRGEVSNDPALTALLRDAGTRWAAATVSAQGAAGLELSSGTAVMAIGGFTGSDPAPTLEQFQAWVAQGQVHYFIASHGGPGGDGSGGDGPGGGALGSGGPGGGGPGGGAAGDGGPGGGSGVSAQIRTWVQQHYTATTVGGQTVYDLTLPPAG